MRLAEPAPAKLNLALHVRGKLPDGRHALETVFAFCTDGDRLEAEPADELQSQAVAAAGSAAEPCSCSRCAAGRRRAAASAEASTRKIAPTRKATW